MRTHALAHFAKAALMLKRSCQEGSAHAFVLKDSDTRAVAGTVSSWLVTDFLHQR